MSFRRRNDESEKSGQDRPSGRELSNELSDSGNGLLQEIAVSEKKFHLAILRLGFCVISNHAFFKLHCCQLSQMYVAFIGIQFFNDLFYYLPTMKKGKALRQRQCQRHNCTVHRVFSFKQSADVFSEIFEM